MNFTLGTQEHDAALRRLARDEAMPGAIRLAYTREPDWFKGQDVLGHFHQTLVGLDSAGQAVASAVRVVRQVFANGSPRDIGYLCGLRSLPDARRGLGLAQGYRFLRRQHDADSRTPVYLTTILESNAAASALLASGRAGLPAYHDLGSLTSYLWRRPSHRRLLLPPGIRIEMSRGMPDEDLIAFLQQEGAKRQFFPFVDRFSANSPPWLGFAAMDFCTAKREGRIVGAAGRWDQRAYRQIRVAGYAPALALLRPAINSLARLTRLSCLPALPRVGAALEACFATLVCIENDDPLVFSAIMRGLYDKALAAGCPTLIVSLHERSRLNAVFGQSDRLFACRSRLYCACWEDGETLFRSLDKTLKPHIEGGML